MKRILSSCIFIFLSLLLIINVFLGIKKLNGEVTPSIFGITPLIITSGSMNSNVNDALKPGDLIFVEEIDIKQLKIGDVIAFYRDDKIVTHRIFSIKKNTTNDFEIITKGDMNNTIDEKNVSKNELIGKFVFKIPKVGYLITFLQLYFWLICLCCLFIALIFKKQILLDYIKEKLK